VREQMRQHSRYLGLQGMNTRKQASNLPVTIQHMLSLWCQLSVRDEDDTQTHKD
jgi:hypothetical protein